ANAGQVMIDQYIVAARAKWQLEPSLVMLLPHGYEGPEPEHSSGRIERFLQLAASDNIRLANCTTAAQYFHLLRDQAASLRGSPRPLVIFTPKKLLRHAAAAAAPEALANGHFQPVIDDEAVNDKDTIGRLILCSGKIWVDLITSQQYASGELAKQVAIVRVEQLYPFPEEQVRQIIASYPNAAEVVWVQEEPRNMGAWHFVERRLRDYLAEGQELRYIGRPRWSSPAEGFQSMYAFDQSYLIEEAFAGIPQVGARTFGVKQHAD
ncbi:MAG TPA: 2-oxoglutarate dehydrogenase E1 component, partial [Thermomicrobiaceae bacterium]|nr:2-oxoglutarate dehydrogenase E1 component [Thermomicrobiaceae bacterium]